MIVYPEELMAQRIEQLEAENARLRDAMPPHYGKCRLAADALERLRGYAKHGPMCLTLGKDDCRCGLTAILKELTDG